jgi:predicted nucleotidyltransferase
MVEMKRIKDLTSQIAREFNPERIILFGSHAYGQPGADSDADILVVLPFKGKPSSSWGSAPLHPRLYASTRCAGF